jgi:hypothetical protein
MWTLTITELALDPETPGLSRTVPAVTVTDGTTTFEPHPVAHPTGAGEVLFYVVTRDDTPTLHYTADAEPDSADTDFEPEVVARVAVAEDGTLTVVAVEEVVA